MNDIGNNSSSLLRRDSYSFPTITPDTCSLHLIYIHTALIQEGSRVLYKEAKALLIVQTPNPSRILYKAALIRQLHYDGACNNFKIPSYIPNMMAALGTVLKR